MRVNQEVRLYQIFIYLIRFYEGTKSGYSLKKPREWIYNSQLKVKRVLTSNWKSYMYFDKLTVGQFIFDYLNLKVWELLELWTANPQLECSSPNIQMFHSGLCSRVISMWSSLTILF